MPNESSYMTFYPWLIVTMGLSCTVFMIQPIENMPDLDLPLQGHSRSKGMVPNESSYMTSYPSLIVTIWLSHGFPDIGIISLIWHK